MIRRSTWKKLSGRCRHTAALRLAAAAVLGLLALSGCSENFPDQPQENVAPDTFISLFTDNTLNQTISRQTLNWWGDDPDGIVTGYLYTFSQNAPELTTWDSTSSHPDWTFTTSTRETFILTLTGTDTIYTFRVKAVDDQGLADPTAATQAFPIVNTPPVIEFPAATDVPETTFTVATFTWNASDPDGDVTLDKFEFVLDDTTDPSAWRSVPATQNSLTLEASDGLTEGNHVFYLRARDIAGATSPILRMPRSENSVWYVREPTSRFLLVDDYNIADPTDATYRDIMTRVAGGADHWDIKSRAGALEPPSPEAFTRTLQLYDRVFWYSDSDPNLEKAQISLPDFLDSGGQVIFSTTFKEFTSNQGDPLDFSPIDSLGARISRVTRNQNVLPAQEFSDLGFPDLRVNVAIIPNVFPVVPKISARPVYLLPERAGAWPGTPALAAVDANNTFVFFALPIASLNGNGTVEALFEKILNDVFVSGNRL